jgi:hypothetical protein
VLSTRLPAVRVVAVLIALALVVLAVLQVRSSAAAAQAAQEDARVAAEQELASDVHELRTDLAVPARQARTATASLRVLVGAAVTGTALVEAPDGDPLETVATRTATLRETAVRLERAADGPLPTRPGALRSASLDALLPRLDPLGEQARATAEHLRTAAAEADELAAAALGLHAAARDLVAGTDTLPSSDDPAAVAAAWDEELDRLHAYLEAIEAAEAVPALRALAGVHRDAVEPLATFAEEAVATLAAGDLDAYNDRREAELGAIDTAAVGEALTAATAEVLPQAVQQLEHAEGRALGLLHELERVRRATPPATGSA